MQTKHTMQNKSTIRNTNNTTQHQSIIGNIYMTNMSPQSARKLANPQIGHPLPRKKQYQRVTLAANQRTKFWATI